MVGVGGLMCWDTHVAVWGADLGPKGLGGFPKAFFGPLVGVVLFHGRNGGPPLRVAPLSICL